jgi:hypothetical protein
MPLAVAPVDAAFERTLRPAQDLIQIHKRNPSAGRRVADLSLNKGAIVFAVAAWQAYVEDLMEAVLVALAPPPASSSVGLYQMLAGHARQEIRRFNTPNSQNTLNLLSLVNFDPTPYWTFTFAWERQWSARHGPMRDYLSLSAPSTRRELDAWLLVRHRIAHGASLPADPDHVSGVDHGEAQLLRRNADRCVNFFQGLAMSTSAGAAIAFR